MKKLIAVAALTQAFLIGLAPSHAANLQPRVSGAQKEQKDQKDQKEKSTSVLGSDASCKTYFALTNEIVSVPCSRNAPARLERCQKYFPAVGQLVDVPCGE